jgi:DNA-directed RNA polymerase specialized sigma subunit
LGKQKTVTYLSNGIDISLGKYLQSIMTEINNSQEKSISTPITATVRQLIILIDSIIHSNKTLQTIIEKITSGEILKASAVLGITEEEICNLIRCNLDIIKNELLTLNPEQEVSLVDAVPNNNNQVNLTSQTLIL